MKTLILTITFIASAAALAKDPYTIKPSPYADSEVRLTGVTGDLFATHELFPSKGPNWKLAAETFIEEKTDAVEILGKIEEGTITDHCKIDYDKLDYVDAISLKYKWKALKPVRKPEVSTVLYVVETYGNYIANMTNGKKISCPYLINSYVFLNKTPFQYLGKLAN